MKLYLIQHGEATDEKTDPARPLTEQGRKVVAKTAESLRKARVETDEVWHSTKLRARQTAEIITETLRLKRSMEKGFLGPKDPVALVADMINVSNKNIMIVGHLPFLAKLASLLITGVEDREVVSFKPGKLFTLEKTGPTWTLEWTKKNQRTGLLLIILTVLLVIGLVVGFW